MAKEIAVVESNILFADNGHFTGFRSSSERDYLGIIKKNLEWRVRTKVSKEESVYNNFALENAPFFQQPIPYVWMVNTNKQQVFAYRRNITEAAGEVRLRNKWSCGVGGHVDRADMDEMSKKIDLESVMAGYAPNVLDLAMIRELEEEVKLKKWDGTYFEKGYFPGKPNVVGYVKLDHGVHAVHFAIVAVYDTNYQIEKNDEEMAEGRMFSIPELEELFANPNNEVEEWTQESWPYIKENVLNGKQK